MSKPWNACPLRGCEGLIERLDGSVEFFDGDDAQCPDCASEFTVNVTDQHGPYVTKKPTKKGLFARYLPRHEPQKEISMPTKKSKKVQPRLYVVVRAYSGLFFGQFVDRRASAAGVEVDLANVRQIWNWTSEGLSKPAVTAGDVSLRGVGTGSRVSDPVNEVTVFDVKAIFVCAPEGARVLRAVP